MKFTIDLENELVLYTPCLYTGMFPKCPKAEGKCELEGIARQVWDKDHIIQRCETPALVIKKNPGKNPFEFRRKPLQIVKVVSPDDVLGKDYTNSWRDRGKNS